jgi:hypothetical protein
VVPYGANIRTSRMILLSDNITENLFVQLPMSYGAGSVARLRWVKAPTSNDRIQDRTCRSLATREGRELADLRPLRHQDQLV